VEVLGQPFRQEVQFDFPQTNDDNPEIERMWAFEKVQTLMNRMRASQEDQQTVDEIVRLCEGYSIVSEYASFIVLENDSEYARWSIQRRNATRVERDRAARERLRQDLGRMRDESLSRLGPSQADLVSPPVQAVNRVPDEGLAGDQPQTQPAGQNPGDIHFTPAPSQNNQGGGGGGGAIDPLSGLIAGGLAAAAALAARRRRLQADV
jgi:Ca-activated chloride channel family protein